MLSRDRPARSGLFDAWVPRRQKPAGRSWQPLVDWTEVPHCGRGLVAAADVPAGAVLDLAPAVPADGMADDTVRPYVFMAHRPDGPAWNDPIKSFLVMGPMSMCNHSGTPNASVTFRRHGRRGYEARLTSLRPIKAHEEITISYADSSWYTDNGRF